MKSNANLAVLSATFAAAIGSMVTADGKKMTIDKLLDKMGTTKSGEKAPYIHLTGKGGEAELHPQKAKELLAKGECGIYRMLAEVALPKTKAAKPAPAAEVDKPETKKAGTFRIFKELNVDGKQRQAILDRMCAELGMSKVMAGSYYQSVKHGVWTE